MYFPTDADHDAGETTTTMIEHEPHPQPMDLTHDLVHDYAGFHNVPSSCRVRIYQQPGRTPVIIATELDSNSGTAITNLAEQLCAEVLRAYLPDRFEEDEPVIWVEHYRRTPDELRRRWPEFAHVTFQSNAPRRVARAGRDRLQLGRPEWTHLPRAVVEALVGQPVPD